MYDLRDTGVPYKTGAVDQREVDQRMRSPTDAADDDLRDQVCVLIYIYIYIHTYI